MRLPIIIFILAVAIGAAVTAYIAPNERLNSLVEKMPEGLRVAWAKTEVIEDLFTHRAVTFSPSDEDEVEPVAQSPIPPAAGITIGHWRYNCDEQARRQADCSITHQVAEEDGNVRFSWRIAVEPGGGFRSTWQTATGVRVDRGIVFEAGDEQPLNLSYSSCVDRYCESATELDEKYVEALLQADRASATVRDPQDRPVKYTISVNGLAASLRMLGDESNKI
ncbi:invasion associated locus B family protein [Nitratireductor sp. XY-223]|uniref:invasion associated locus B family protein n=1 Tax=Nitratireductor sp. XY-223 TaxID=2561926 RepID=UPI0010AAB40B|nr:invasion associated locus B family protein [Nitratireductor sp. XY-223]